MAIVDKEIEARRKFVEAWNDTMIKIWKEKITALGVIDTGALLRSLVALPVRSDGRFYELSLSQTFIEYGLWQDLGVGREIYHGNPGDIGREKVRERKRWFSAKYYASVMNLRDFLAESLGNEFKAMISDALDADEMKKNSAFYRRKGYS